MRYIFLITLTSFIMINCSGDRKDTGDKQIMDQSVKNNLQTIENVKIFFGHQSVGYNIINGLRDLLNEASDGSIKIMDLDENKTLSKSYFSHSRIGKNKDTETKCDDFSEKINSYYEKGIDIALLKFCFVDIIDKSNPNAVFDYYRTTLDSLKKRYPKTHFIHVTIPLTTVQKGWKALVKKILGKEIMGYSGNIKRFQYNELLRNYYEDDAIFDLSKVESTYLNGKRESFEVNGKEYYSLISEYASDSGHLNELGRRIAAKELIHIIAETIKNQ